MSIEGHRPFDNDGAFDWLSMVRDHNPTGYVESAFRAAVNASYLDVDDGASAVAAAAVLAAAVDGDMSDLPEKARELAKSLEPSGTLQEFGAKALGAVLEPESSELYALLREADDYELWRATVERIRSRLSTTASRSGIR